MVRHYRTGSDPLTVDLRFREAARRMEQLVLALQRRRSQIGELFEDIESLLAGLPLAGDEYASAQCHIRNANRYHGRGEDGAAGYELRLMARAFRS